MDGCREKGGIGPLVPPVPGWVLIGRCAGTDLVEVGGYLAHSADAVFSVFDKHLVDELGQIGGNVGANLSQIWWWLVEDGGDERGHLRALEGWFSSQHFEKHDAECPYVGTAVERFAVKSFGTHVGQGSH